VRGALVPKSKALFAKALYDFLTSLEATCRFGKIIACLLRKVLNTGKSKHLEGGRISGYRRLLVKYRMILSNKIYSPNSIMSKHFDIMFRGGGTGSFRQMSWGMG
jgi:hypothetical protein